MSVRKKTENVATFCPKQGWGEESVRFTSGYNDSPSNPKSLETETFFFRLRRSNKMMHILLPLWFLNHRGKRMIWRVNAEGNVARRKL